MGTTNPQLEELRRLARAMVAPAAAAGEAAVAYARAFKAALPDLTPEDVADPVIAEAMGEMGKPVKNAHDAITLHGVSVFGVLPLVSRTASRMCVEALSDGIETAQRTCTCDDCTAAREIADASIARARVAAGAPR